MDYPNPRSLHTESARQAELALIQQKLENTVREEKQLQHQQMLLDQERKRRVAESERQDFGRQFPNTWLPPPQHPATQLLVPNREASNEAHIPVNIPKPSIEPLPAGIPTQDPSKGCFDSPSTGRRPGTDPHEAPTPVQDLSRYENMRLPRRPESSSPRAAELGSQQDITATTAGLSGPTSANGIPNTSTQALSALLTSPRTRPPYTTPTSATSSGVTDNHHHANKTPPRGLRQPPPTVAAMVSPSAAVLPQTGTAELYYEQVVRRTPPPTPAYASPFPWPPPSYDPNSTQQQQPTTNTPMGTTLPSSNGQPLGGNHNAVTNTTPQHLQQQQHQRRRLFPDYSEQSPTTSSYDDSWQNTSANGARQPSPVMDSYYQHRHGGLSGGGMYTETIHHYHASNMAGRHPHSDPSYGPPITDRAQMALIEESRQMGTSPQPQQQHQQQSQQQHHMQTGLLPPPHLPHELQQQQQQQPGSQLWPEGATPSTPTNKPLSNSGYERALQNLKEFSKDLQAQGDLYFNENSTCVVDVSGCSIIITYDPNTNRLYLYSTLLEGIPQQQGDKLALYETLLAGALLGREMAGGSVGVSARNDYILLCTSIPMDISTASSLRTVAPLFVDSYLRWKQRVHDVLGLPDVVIPLPPQQQAQQSQQDMANSSSVGCPSPPPPPTTPPPAATSGAPTRSPRSPDSGGHTRSRTRSPSANRLQQQYGLMPGTRNQYQYAGIGLQITDGVKISGTFKRYTDGVVVVLAKGAAARAGIIPNDIVTKVDNHRVTSLSDFQQVAKMLQPGTCAAFTIERQGQTQTVDVYLDSTVSRPGTKKYKNWVKIADDSSIGNQTPPSNRR